MDALPSHVFKEQPYNTPGSAMVAASKSSMDTIAKSLGSETSSRAAPPWALRMTMEPWRSIWCESMQREINSVGEGDDGGTVVRLWKAMMVVGRTTMTID
ncbi:hypothetical protein PIB30_089701 [Stylosanthes scabra]|uniref:Uncharacterized protein n=1 Tax=Stylosanthes scabra TaxID=79078 RepID=A0ABU6SUD4_9FABA|nr:hypothetical protein [Stylosanthes scabra]